MLITNRNIDIKRRKCITKKSKVLLFIVLTVTEFIKRKLIQAFILASYLYIYLSTASYLYIFLSI